MAIGDPQPGCSPKGGSSNAPRDSNCNGRRRTIVVRFVYVERALTNKPVEISLNKDATRIKDDINPIDDFRASRHYRLQVARNLLQEQVLLI